MRDTAVVFLFFATVWRIAQPGLCRLSSLNLAICGSRDVLRGGSVNMQVNGSDASGEPGTSLNTLDARDCTDNRLKQRALRSVSNLSSVAQDRKFYAGRPF